MAISKKSAWRRKRKHQHRGGGSEASKESNSADISSISQSSENNRWRRKRKHGVALYGNGIAVTSAAALASA